MSKQPLPSRWENKGKLKKIGVGLYIIILVLSSILFPQTAVATAKWSNDIEWKKQIQSPSWLNEYLDNIREEGYSIVSYNLDIHNLPITDIIRLDNKEYLQDNLDVIVSCVELKIGNEKYYFKNSSEAQVFIDRLNAIKEQTYSMTNDNVSYSTITSTEVLENKIAQVTEEREKELEERKLQELSKAKVTSRGGYSRAKEGAFPLEKYSYVSSWYGPRWEKQHTGIDFAASAGTNIRSWKSGTITFAGWNGGYGYFIEVNHGNGQVSRYAHCSKIAVSKGQTVSQGDVIGYVGTTGNSTGNHLHFEIKVNGNFVNPADYLSI